MKLPKTLNLSGYEIKIRYKKNLKDNGDSCYGVWVESEKTIYLSYGMPETRKKDIFLHELLHAISDVYRIEMSEESTGNIARALLYVFKTHNINLSKKRKNEK